MNRRVSIHLLGGLVVLTSLLPACTSGPAEEQPLDRGPRVSDPGFHDVAAQTGLDFRQGAFRWNVSADPVSAMGSGVCWLDYDADGWMDLYAVNSYTQDEATRWEVEGGLPRSGLFHNVDGRFVDVSAGSGADLAVRGGGCVAADLNLDGRTDLYVTSDRSGTLLWNEGDGRFSDGTEAAGVEAFGWHTGAAVGDVNGDGWPDLFLAGYADLINPIAGATLGFPNTHLGVRDLLYLSEPSEGGGRPTFREVGADAGLEAVNFEYGLGALFSDLDGDGDLDLYVANDTKPNRLYENVPWPGGATADPTGLGFRFEELAARAGVADPNAGMGVAEGDFDNDGLSDLFVTNAHGQLHAAYQGRVSDLVNPSFVDVRSELGPDLGGFTGWGVTWADLDLDTDLDLLLVNGNVPVTSLTGDAEPVQVFENLTAQGEPGRFEDLSVTLPSLLARGSAAADFDNDGDMDVAINILGGQLVLLENTIASGHALEVATDRSSPGALVTAVLPGGRQLTCEIHAGSSYLSSEDPRCLFGLGAADHVSELRVRWPGGAVSVLTEVGADQGITVEVPA